jgi:hypothetical protein
MIKSLNLSHSSSNTSPVLCFLKLIMAYYLVAYTKSGNALKSVRKCPSDNKNANAILLEKAIYLNEDCNVTLENSLTSVEKLWLPYNK